MSEDDHIDETNQPGREAEVLKRYKKVPQEALALLATDTIFQLAESTAAQNKIARDFINVLKDNPLLETQLISLIHRYVTEIEKLVELAGKYATLLPDHADTEEP